MNTNSLFKPYHYLGADAYGTGVYGCGEYQEGCTTTGTGDDGGLVNTGYNVIIPVAFASALIIAAAILLITKFVRKRKARSNA